LDYGADHLHATQCPASCTMLNESENYTDWRWIRQK